MTAVVVAFIANAAIGFNLSYDLSVVLGIVAAVLALGVFLVKFHTRPKAVSEN